MTALPSARGPVSSAVIDVLAGRGSTADLPHRPDGDPLGDDLQLALYCCYELHYRSFDGVADDLEWDPDLLRLRAHLEDLFLAAVRAEVAGGDDVEAAVDALLVEPTEGTGPSWHLARDGERWQLDEYVAHRSIYHLKEADPQAWVIPRLDGVEGRAKASLMTVEHDEYGAGRPERVHARIYSEMMAGLGLETAYGAYLDVAPAATLATVNIMSLFGLHRRWRGASVGQFALIEVTSPPGAARLVTAIERLGLPAEVTAFYAEHVEADAVHEQLVRRELLAGLLEREPELAADVVLGIQASTWLEDRLADQLVAAWSAGESSLLAVPAPA
ncbi:iron-containing redox enzyme family protein [Actinomycetospora lutea]|uniref:iron-containing redox enzyme family protein n=1 Tax=Actinomycetospora lutea TaxID=663604 RepID=UPI00236591B9|nr:iron-containing redox enzyme family protein [Actinomycetospora lutea]MDD7942398.1 iron-containing redox enzyme family protein [Actinomycetospora lutea]